MRWSKLYLPTYKESPSDAEIPSHKLMIRAGAIKKLTSGVYTFLPVGFRVLRKIEAIVREEMDAIGSQEILMPILHPAELYEESGRLQNFGPELFKLNDRKQRMFALGPTHEEVVTDLARAEMRSYRQLPQTLYQILTKFRDEIRPRFGVMRAREFIMKDAYSFHDSDESLEVTYQDMAGAYHRILDRCGLDHMMVEADAGVIGGDVNHEFIVLTEAGESEIFTCSCGYTANSERAESLGQPLSSNESVAEGSPVRVETPGQKTIDEVSAFLEADPSQLVKTLLYRSEGQIVAALIPGDRSLNEVKLMKLLGDPQVQTLGDQEILDVTGAPVGFSGPVGLPKSTRIIADKLLESYEGMIVGANENDAHLRGVKMGRDFVPTETASISEAKAGDTCPRCAKYELVTQRGVELGHIFKLGKKYSRSMNATYLDRDGKDHKFIMGCYGFGVSRAVAAAVEANHDERGIVWPRSITPFHAIVLPINVSDDHTIKVAESIYAELSEQGLDVLFDDRDLRAGFRFKDADLIGVPLRITLGERSLRENKIEIYYRGEDRSELVDPGNVAGLIKAYYDEKPAA
ncbi:MAG: proline--tRNA ligase [Candidatus Latescibacterota bacterium]|nr:MAG: proline--tRNA ligase [Candidatus Latescibacterota bacterium]